MDSGHLQNSDVSWYHDPRGAAFRPQTLLPVEGARHLPEGVEVPALLRPEGRAPKFRFTGRGHLQNSDANRVHEPGREARARLCEPQQVAAFQNAAGRRPALRDGRFMKRALSQKAAQLGPLLACAVAAAHLAVIMGYAYGTPLLYGGNIHPVGFT